MWIEIDKEICTELFCTNPSHDPIFLRPAALSFPRAAREPRAAYFRTGMLKLTKIGNRYTTRQLLLVGLLVKQFTHEAGGNCPPIPLQLALL